MPASVTAERQLGYHTASASLPYLGKTAILETFEHLQLPTDHYFVLGGANLVLRGIKRATTDVDMLVSDETFESLASQPGAEIHSPPLPAIRRGAQNVTVWLHNSRTPVPVSATTSLGDGYYPMSFTSHHDHTELVEGIPCILLDDVVAAKQALQRPKDLDDLRLIAAYLGETEPSIFSTPTIPGPWPTS